MKRTAPELQCTALVCVSAQGRITTSHISSRGGTYTTETKKEESQHLSITRTVGF